MPSSGSTFGWQEAVAALVAITFVAFLVTWVVTDLLDVSRGPYIAILGLTVAALSSGYLVWSGTSLDELVASGWAWGLIAGLVAAAIITPLVRRLPAREHPRGMRLASLFVWEDLIYGTEEALLLATLPVLAAWQAMADLGWTDGAWAEIGCGVVAIVAALIVILVHHLGYAQFRARAARRELGGVLLGCGIQALTFLVTGNVLAPIVAHVLLHTQLTLRGVEMPPASQPAASVGASREIGARRSTQVMAGVGGP
jgi:hypothetical protein